MPEESALFVTEPSWERIPRCLESANPKKGIKKKEKIKRNKSYKFVRAPKKEKPRRNRQWCETNGQALRSTSLLTHSLDRSVKLTKFFVPVVKDFRILYKKKWRRQRDARVDLWHRLCETTTININLKWNLEHCVVRVGDLGKPTRREGKLHVAALNFDYTSDRGSRSCRSGASYILLRRNEALTPRRSRFSKLPPSKCCAFGFLTSQVFRKAYLTIALILLRSVGINEKK